MDACAVGNPVSSLGLNYLPPFLMSRIFDSYVRLNIRALGGKKEQGKAEWVGKALDNTF